MKLVDPKPMETLPEDGRVFWEFERTNSNGIFRYTKEERVRVVNALLKLPNYVGVAWSHTATVKD